MSICFFVTLNKTFPFSGPRFCRLYFGDNCIVSVFQECHGASVLSLQLRLLLLQGEGREVREGSPESLLLQKHCVWTLALLPQSRKAAVGVLGSSCLSLFLPFRWGRHFRASSPDSLPLGWAG